MPTSLNNPNRFPFTIPQDSLVTSAGVYDLSNKLIRTLWSNIPYKAGIHAQYWDGLDDNGIQQPYNNYNINISSNNNTYVWEGVFATTGPQTGPNVWRGGTQIADMVQVGNYMYCATGFSEGDAAQCKFLTSAPNQCLIYTPKSTTQGSMMNCANSTYIFWGGMDYRGINSFIYGENISTGLRASFTSGTLFTPPTGIAYPSVLAISTAPISGMAVQQAGLGFLFVSYTSLNLINVYEIGDGTGRLVQSITITAPAKLCLENDATLWVAQGTSVSKYTVNSNGTITAAGSNITGLSNACGLSAHSGELAILDGGTQQVPKFYNTTTLAPIIKGTWLSGGYANTPTVANNRLYLYDIKGQYITFIRHDNLGGFWIGDSGNCRCLHFDNTGTWLETLMYLPFYTTYITGPKNKIIYNVNICKNQPTAVFIESREFLIDYNQPLQSGWTLLNNWGYNIPPGWGSGNTVGSVALLPNNRRYMVINKNSNTYTSFGLTISTSPIGGFLPAGTYYYRIYAQNSGNSQSLLSSEISITTTGTTSSVTLNWNLVTNATSYRVDRGTAPGAQNTQYTPGNVSSFIDTGAAGTLVGPPITYNSQVIAELTISGLRIYDSVVPPNFTMDDSGNLSTTSVTGSGPTLTSIYQKYPLIGYNGSNNLLFGPVSTVATLLLGNQGTRPQQTELLTTANGKIILFDPSRTLPRVPNLPTYHLTAYDVSTFTQLWQTCVGTFQNFYGDFPMDGRFDIGNSVIYPGGTAAVASNDIYFNYHGENWHKSETNMLYHYNDIGLLQGLFGVLGPQLNPQGATAAFSGNSLSIHVCQVGGNTYIYLNDESNHGGAHRWKVTQIQQTVQTVPFTLVANSFISPQTRINLLAGVPIGQVSVAGTPGWTQTPSVDIINTLNHYASGQFYTITNLGNADSSASVQLNATPIVGLRSLSVDLPSLSDTSYWSLSGVLDFSFNGFVSLEPASLSTPDTQGSTYLEITDGAGKSIARLYTYRTGRLSFNKTFFASGGNSSYGSSKFILSRQQNNIYLGINIYGQWFSLLQPLYDPTADITNPIRVSIRINNLISTYQVGINKLELF